MNCNEIQNIINSQELIQENKSLIVLHIESCVLCKNYYNLVNELVENPQNIWDEIEPAQNLANSISNFIFENNTGAIKVPLWLKISSAAAAIVLGLFIGSTVYDSRVSAQNTEAYSYIETEDTLYMAETTEIMYYSAIMDNEGE
ncbi:MAG: hypothetical protein CVU11_05010 [Bacteroidetes bacterium HGW-Bacteroidetes-6]|jgi:hypothetical protein|nr:MAG: hypothetical protein CVU11_05010 [Bacteroidetes bacterium HGW-Bacteroidetes-6]